MKKAEHFLVAIAATPKKDDTRFFCMAYSEELGKIEVCCDYDTVLFVCFVNYLNIFCIMQTDIRGMDGIVAILIKPAGKLVRNRHVHQEIHANSMISSSANAAA